MESKQVWVWSIPFSLLAFDPTIAATLLVDPAGAGDARDIQSAIDVAVNGDTVLVRPGEYQISNAINLHGKAIAVRSEDGPATTTIRFLRPSESVSLLASLVVFEEGERSQSILEGFTLAGGHGEAACDVCMRRGGGIYAAGVSPTLRNLVITQCVADQGGGIYLGEGASPLIEGCEIMGNEADVGGGLFVEGSSAPRMTKASISLNHAYSGGGLYAADGASPRLEDSIISRNRATEGGGLTTASASLRLVACSIDRNAADLGAGILLQLESEAALVSCSTWGNIAELWGGGVFLDQSSIEVWNSTLTGNGAGIGSAIHGERSGIVMDHTTVARNVAEVDETIHLFKIERPVRITSSVIWENKPASIVLNGLNSWPDPELSNNCIEGSFGANNIDQDPKFCGWTLPEISVDARNSDPRNGSLDEPFPDLSTALATYSLALASNSPCLGTGVGHTNLGADLGTCTSPRQSLLLHVRAGDYALAGVLFCDGVSIEGAGWERTVLHGTVREIESGAHLSDVTVTGGRTGGVIVTSSNADSPDQTQITDCRIVENKGTGVYISDKAALAMKRCAISGSLSSEGISYGIQNDGGATVLLSHCTITRNAEGGIWCGVTSPIHGGMHIEDCIIWGNVGKAIEYWAGGYPVEVRSTCIQGGFQGTGNINRDPLFCNFSVPEVYVDSNWPQGGDGSGARPFSDLKEALARSRTEYSLQEGSPCIGSGAGGSTMGAVLETCAVPGEAALTVHLAPGTYSVPSPIAPGISYEGSGPRDTVLVGSIHGLRSDTVLSHLTVRGGGVQVAPNSSPRMDDCAFEEAVIGIDCGDGSSPEITRSILRRNRIGIQFSYATPSLTNSLIAENITGIAGYGGVGTFLNCTLADNQEGLFANGGPSAILASSIIWGNWVSIRLQNDASVDVQSSLIQGDSPWSTDGNNLSADPLFAGPGDYHLRPASPAIDPGYGSSGDLPDDLDGHPRPCGNGVDLGAYEFCEQSEFPPVRFHRGDPDQSGLSDISDAIGILGFLFLGNAAPACLETADVDNDGRIDVSDGIALLTWLFASGRPPAGPGPVSAACGIDPDPVGSPRDLGCESYRPCL